MKNPCCNQRGFSLIELLIAATVVASASALLIGGLLAANRGTDLRIDQVLTTQVLASQLAQMDDALSPQTPTSGSVPSLEGWTWTLQWNESPLTPLQETTLTLTHQDRTTRVVTYRPLAKPQ